jgi:hypothetical protein
VKDGKRRKRTTEFTVTNQVQNRDGWVDHHVGQPLCAKDAATKLRSIHAATVRT